jgi:sterol desaturase/sphingolipid hydroxylase (fatty acid hydroxylase superfamily)
MPTPIEVLFDPISLITIGIYAALILWEQIAPAAKLADSWSWPVRGITAFFIFLYVSTYLPLIWGEYLAPFQLLDLSGVHPAVAAIVGLLVFEFSLYWWHRGMHETNALWRMFHQMHHSAERVDTFGAFYFSPMDMIGFTALSSLALTIVGLSPQATTAVILLTTFLSTFQHTNIRTPQWLGYIVQRPESHSVHHAKGIHAYNYSDLPVFDLLFGTFRNPPTRERDSGFYAGASERLLDMLVFKDINRTTTRGRDGRTVPGT